MVILHDPLEQVNGQKRAFSAYGQEGGREEEVMSYFGDADKICTSTGHINQRIKTGPIKMKKSAWFKLSIEESWFNILSFLSAYKLSL